MFTFVPLLFLCPFARLIVYEVVSLSVTLVFVVVLAPGLVPSAVVGEEGVGSLWRVIDLGEAEPLSQVERLGIDAGSTCVSRISVSVPVPYWL